MFVITSTYIACVITHDLRYSAGYSGQHYFWCPVLVHVIPVDGAPIELRRSFLATILISLRPIIFLIVIWIPDIHITYTDLSAIVVIPTTMLKGWFFCGSQCSNWGCSSTTTFYYPIYITTTFKLTLEIIFIKLWSELKYCCHIGTYSKFYIF